MVSKLILFHLPVYLYYLYVLAYEFINIKKGSEGYGGKFKYLTIWNAVFQLIYFGLSSANDCCGTNIRPSENNERSKSTLQKWRDCFLASVVLPLGMFTVVIFWGLYAIDRELIFPKVMDAIIPPWLNHALHTNLLPILLVDMFLVYHQFPSKKTGITILISTGIVYLIWMLWIKYVDDFWVYPILRVLQLPQRIAFIACLLFMFILFYLTGDLVNKVMWGKERYIALKANGKKRS